MSGVNSWQSGTAAFMALAVVTSATTPIMMPAPASAQLFPQTSQISIPRGTSIPVRYSQTEKLVANPNETKPLTLTVATNVINRSGTILLSAGSQVFGQLQPVSGGAQFVATELVTPEGRRQTINATSGVISKTQQTRGANLGSILTGAAAGSAAAAGISGVAGDRKITAGKVLIGTGAGAVGGLLLGRNKTDAIVIEPNAELNITLNSSLPVSY